jgi:drug/metabolite transporter (DMT)-like permease
LSYPYGPTSQCGSPGGADGAAAYHRRVSVSVQIGLLFALATALSSIVGFLYKHRGAVEAPAVEWRRPLASSAALFRSRWYALGIAVALGSWFLHVTALALAPISLVQATIAGGLVLLTVVADRVFGFDVTRREWIGVALTALGLAFLAGTLGATGDTSHADFDAPGLAAYIALAAVAGTALVAASRGGPRDASLLACSAGLIWGASDVSIKALSGRLEDLGPGVLVHPLALVILVLSLVGLLVSARSLQLGDAVPVIAVTSATANVLTIASGPIVFGEPLPDDPLALSLRLLAFALVIAAAALTPPPVRAASTA